MKIKDVVYGLGIRFCCHTITLYRNDNGRMIYYGMVCDVPRLFYNSKVKLLSECDTCLQVTVE